MTNLVKCFFFFSNGTLIKVSLVFKTARNSQTQIKGGSRWRNHGANREGCKYKNSLVVLLRSRRIVYAEKWFSAGSVPRPYIAN